MAVKNFHKVIIGRSESLALPKFEIANIPAKVDTGAYRSAIHASAIHEKDGLLKFALFKGHPIFGSFARTMSTRNFSVVQIANSFGHTEKRYEVNLRVKISYRVFTAKFTLANRTKKVYPILLGRTLLSDRFIINVGRSGVDRAALKDMGIEFPSDEEDGR